MAKEMAPKAIEHLSSAEREGWLKDGKLPVARKRFDRLEIKKIDGHHQVTKHFRYDGGGSMPEPEVKMFGPNEGDEALMHIATHAGIRDPEAMAEEGTKGDD